MIDTAGKSVNEMAKFEIHIIQNCKDDNTENSGNFKYLCMATDKPCLSSYKSLIVTVYSQLIVKDITLKHGHFTNFEVLFPVAPIFKITVIKENEMAFSRKTTL